MRISLFAKIFLFHAILVFAFFVFLSYFALNTIKDYYIDTYQKETKMTDKEKSNQESFRVSGDELLSKIKEIFREGKARKVIIKNEKDETIMEFSLKMGAIGVLLAPQLAAIGAIAAIAKDWTIIVEKKAEQEE